MIMEKLQIYKCSVCGNIVEVLKVKECNKKYPRKAGTVNKNPLK